ncbi:Ig-like domain-containing protein [Pontibacter oryzae]|nr:gliding motility-associated C-terminal domain-containing protein [Pontibacter oryzae]
MKIFLPLLYALLVLTGQTPAPTPLPQAADAVEGKKQALFYSSVFSSKPTPASTMAPCNANATLVDSGAGPFGSPFMNCSSVGSTYTLQVQNNSTTKSTNTGYRINWGDGTATQTFGANFTGTTHNYTSRGSFVLTFTAIDNSGCETSTTYKVYNLSNPGFSVGNPGSTTACLSPEQPTVTFRFPVSAIESNPDNTVYTFTFDDGSPAEVYTHAEMIAKKEIVHTFVESSCSMPTQSFSIKGRAEYMCGATKMSTPGSIEGIVINKSTEADFTVSGGPLYCAGNEITFGQNIENPELCPISYDWSVLDGVEGTDWVFTQGTRSSAIIRVKFLKDGTYRVRLKTITAGCGEDEVIKSVVIREAADAKFDVTLDKGNSCEDLKVTAVNTSKGYNLTYAWSVKYNNGNANSSHYNYVSGNANSASPVFLLTRIGTYKLTLVASNGCSSSTFTKDVVVKGLPTVSFKNPTLENCGPYTVDYNNSLNKGSNNGTISAYTWSVDNGGAFTGGTNSSSANPKISFPAAGTYRVRVTVQNECGSSTTAEQVVTINSLPSIPEVDDMTVCQNDKPTLTVKSPQSGFSYRWYSQATGGSQLNSGNGVSFTAPNALTSDTKFYVETVSDKGCVSPLPREEVSIKVLTAVTGNSISTTKTVFCEGAVPDKFTGGDPAGGGGAPYTFLWEISTDGSTFTDATGTNTERDYTPSQPLTGNTWVRRKVFNNPCQTVISNEVKLEVIPTPEKPELQNQEVCYNQNVTLTIDNADTKVNYTWYDAPSGGNIVASGTSYTLNTLKNDITLYVSATADHALACAQPERGTVTVTVTPPLVGGDAISSPASTVCYNSSPGKLTGNAPTGGNGTYTYIWLASTGSSTGGYAEVYRGSDPDYTPAPLTQKTWFKREAYSGSCMVASNVVEVDVEALPVAPTVSGTTLLCFGGSTTLMATAPGGTYIWYDKDGNTLQQGNSFETPALEATTTYYVSATSALGCEGAQQAVTVTIVPAIANNNISGNQTICSGSTPSELGGSLPTGGSGSPYTYYWEYSTDEGVTFQPAPGDNGSQSYTPTAALTQDTWFRRKVSSAPCLDAESNLVKVTVLALPTAPVVPDAEACYASKVTLEVQSPEDGVKYIWYDESDAVVKVGPTYQTPTLTSSKVYFVEAVLNNANACVAESRTRVMVDIVPQLLGGDIISTPKAAVCAGSSPGMLTGEEPTGGTGSYTYQWYASTTSATAGFEKIENATNRTYVPENMQQTTWFKREVYSASCMKTSIVIRVVVEDAPTAPTVNGNTDICFGGGTVLTASAASGTYNWYDASGNRLHTGSSFSPQNLEATTTYFVKAESASGCASPATEITVTVVPTITNSISANQTICSNEAPAALGGGISGGNGSDSYTILWEYSSGGAAFGPAPGNNNEESYSPGALTTTTTYRRLVTSGGCTTRSNEVTITIANTISSNLISGSQTICAGSTPATLTGNGSGTFAYQWYASTTSATAGFEKIEGATDRDLIPSTLNDPTWFRREIISGTCTSMSNTVFVKVEPALAKNTIRTDKTELCYGDRPDIISGEQPEGGNGNYTYLWQWTKASEPGNYKSAPGNNTANDYVPNPNDPALKLTESVYFRRIVTSGTCSQNISQEVLISVIPQVVNQISSANNSLCVGQVPEPFVSATPVSGGKNSNYTFRWERSYNGGNWQVVASSEIYTPQEGLEAGTWQYRRAAESGGCEERMSNTISITVYTAIEGNTLNAVEPVCVGNTITITGAETLRGGNGRYTYAWEQSINGTDFFTITGQEESKLTVPATERGFFRRIVKSDNCESISPAIEVQVQQPVAVQISGAQSLCIGGTFNPLKVTSLTGGSSSSNVVQWLKSESGAAGPYVAIPGATSDTYQPVAISKPTWFMVRVNGHACSEAYSNFVKVEYYPEIVNKIGNSQTVCAGSPVTAIGSTTPVSGGDGQNYTYVWKYSSNGTTYNTVAGANDASYTPQNVSTLTYYKRIITSGGCTSESDAVTVDVKTAPVNQISIANNHICSGTVPDRIISAMLGGTSDPYTYTWQQSTDGINYSTISGAVDATYQPKALTKTTWFKRTVRSTICGQTESNVLRVQVDQPIKDNFILTKPAPTCIGQPLQLLEGSNITGGNGNPTYQWLASEQGPTTGFVPAPGTNTGKNYQPSNLARTTWFKRVVYAGPCQEVESDAVEVRMVKVPDAPTASDVKVCIGSAANLTAQAKAGESLQWYDKPTGGKLIGTGTTYTSGKLYNNASFYVQATNANDCVSPTRHEVKVQVVEPKAVVSEDVTITEGKAVTLTASGGVSYSWSPAAGLSDPNSATPKASPKQTTTYTVTATTEEGCTASAKVTVTVVPRVDAANVITPNGDNKNDRFKIRNIENYPNCRVQIFSRWGELVFESKGYTELQEWDGTRQGVQLPTGAYYYIIHLNEGTEEPVSGSVTIIR